MRLRVIMGWIAGILSVPALVATVGLIVATSRLHDTAELLGDSMNSVRIAKRLEVNLLLHGHVSNLAAMAGTLEHAPPRERVQGELRLELARARRYVSNEIEARLLAETEREVERYLMAVLQFEAEGLPPLEVMNRSRPLLDRAFARTQELVVINVEQGRSARAMVRRWDRLSNLGAVAIAITLALGVIGALTLVHLQLYRPLLQTRNAIARYGAGERQSRVEESGAAELREIARAFNAMATALEQQRDQRLTFLAGVAHDLRNPLSALGAAAGIIAPSRPLPPAAQIHNVGEVVGRQVKRLNAMIEDLLDATRIEAGRLDLRMEVRDARGLVREAVELYGRSSPRHEFELIDADADEPLFVHCDPGRLDQVLGNLLSNAIKYSPRGGRVEVRLTRDDRDVVIAVRDEGIGIAPEDIGRIFEPFQRTGATREAFPGTGLGLSVVRRIVEAHHGRVEVDSTPGSGTELRVRLPRADKPR